MMEGARVGKSKEKLYAEWKILQKYYKKLKGYRDRRIRKKGSSEQISEILRVSLSRNVVHVLGRLKACNKHDGLMNMMTIFYKYKRILMRKGLDSLL